jgi:putative heme transporter
MFLLYTTTHMSSKIDVYLKQHWRGILNLITFAAMILLIYALRHQIMETLDNIQHVNYWVLLLVIPLQLLNYDAYARMYRDILAHLGQPVRYRSLYRVGLELNFVNHAFPSGGVSGISYFSVRLRNYGVKASTATLLQLFKFMLVFLSFQLVLAFGLLALAIGNKANDLIILFATMLSTLTAVGTFGAAYVISSRARIRGFFAGMTKLLNRLIHVVRPQHPETISVARLEGVATDMHGNYVALKGNLGVVRTSLRYALIGNVTEILTIYVFYVAFGEWVNIGAVIIAYAIANFAGLISVLPGGIGVYEALMFGVLAAAGIPAGLSIPVIVMYRVVNMTIQLLPGWVLYHRSLNEGESRG